MIKNHILDVGSWDIKGKRWGDVSRQEIIKRYIELSKQLKEGDKNYIWVMGRYTKFLEACNYSYDFFQKVQYDILNRDVILEDDGGNNLNYYFLGRDKKGGD